jgi:hypothetical protein
MLTHKTRANHCKRRLVMGGHLWLDEGPTPALVFRAHGFFQRRYELRLPLADIQSSSGWTIKMTDGTTERFIVASGTGLAEAMAAARLPRRRTSSVSGDDDPGNPYWWTGNYDPQRYYGSFRGMTREDREYISNAYDDLDTYESNRPD